MGRSMQALGKLRAAAKRLGHDGLTVWFIARDPRTPLPLRFLALAVGAYALSPIDLIPDFIPLLGHLDDLILLPLLILLILRLTPVDVLEASRARASTVTARFSNKVAAVVIVLLWLALAAVLGWWLLEEAGW
ncbi:YkvA family protein [Desulfuromonas carbonis]|uniref:YkvA family protein n=1 Tax=Desulfuromonas sp. DDH964 TaxID=1823759 RepID=UPI00078D1F5D|nr:DUF1232 domain-containing protein [Desulfuromonas sp. DDH964]AMV71897.1 hypothetical protein DBW_1535 [Desulfuromonas sp. DDH964]